jgi:hypothetical protein
MCTDAYREALTQECYSSMATPPVLSTGLDAATTPTVRVSTISTRRKRIQVRHVARLDLYWHQRKNVQVLG